MLRNGLEPTHLLLVLAVIMLFVGGKKLPELARGMGQGMRIFKSEMHAIETPPSSEGTADTADSSTATPRAE